MRTILLAALLSAGLAQAKEPPVTPTKKALQCAFSMETDVILNRNARTKEEFLELSERIDASRECADEALRILPKNAVRAAFAKVESRYSLAISERSRVYEQEFAIAVADLRAAAR